MRGVDLAATAARERPALSVDVFPQARRAASSPMGGMRVGADEEAHSCGAATPSCGVAAVDAVAPCLGLVAGGIRIASQGEGAPPQPCANADNGQAAAASSAHSSRKDAAAAAAAAPCRLSRRPAGRTWSEAHRLRVHMGACTGGRQSARHPACAQPRQRCAPGLPSNRAAAGGVVPALARAAGSLARAAAGAEAGSWAACRAYGHRQSKRRLSRCHGIRQ
mmetsp:Transcript_14201/g.43563  ORF Transcript_14201/g.43563 Transcript_14201/m.43563 type:complete len:221 (+) Transcript_14201:1162-1824(+)